MIWYRDLSLLYNFLTCMYLYAGIEYKDHQSGAKLCAAIAKKVYQEMTNDGAELFLTLKKKSNFEWTQSPQVRTA